MKQFLTLFKLEFKNRRKIVNSNHLVTNKILQIFSFVLKTVLITLIGLVISRYIIRLFVANDIENEFLLFYILLFQGIQFINLLIALTKSLYSVNESKEILSMPIDYTKMFFAKAGYMFVQQFYFMLVLLVPVLIEWGVMTSQTYSFYLMILPCVLLIPIVPFFLATILSIPTVKIMNLLEKRFVITFIMFAVLIGVGFYFYIDLLKLLMTLLNAENYASIMTLEMVDNIQIFASSLYLELLFKNMLLFTNFLKSALVVITICFVCIGLTYVLVKAFYFGILRRSVMRDPKFAIKKTKLKKQNIFWLLMKKEFLTIYRTPNYAFSFLTIALTMPIIVFCANSILTEIGVLQVGARLYPALTLLIILIFMTLITSFAATSITREGRSFVLTKTMPVSAITQTKAKICLYMSITLCAILVSGLVLYFSNYIQLLDFFVISMIGTLVSYGGICNAVNVDTKHPQFNYLSDNLVLQNNSNIAKSVISNLIFAFIIGVASIVLVLLLPKLIWYAIIITCALIFALICRGLLFKNYNKKYYNIEY